jgi:hypothetical protein
MSEIRFLSEDQSNRPLRVADKVGSDQYGRQQYTLRVDVLDDDASGFERAVATKLFPVRHHPPARTRRPSPADEGRIFWAPLLIQEGRRGRAGVVTSGLSIAPTMRTQVISG